MAQFHFDPTTYDELMAAEVPAYPRLQAAVRAAARDPGGTAATATAAGRAVRRFLDLGVGTGVTARQVLDEHPDAEVVGIDESEAMLAHARLALPEADLRTARLEDRLPDGPFDLVVSALAVHHLDGAGKADLFRRVAGVLAPGGRFVLGDVVVPEDPADVVTPIDGEYDTPSSTAEQLAWMAEAGFVPRVTWQERDLAVLAGDLLR
jgi:tRNA (cmo5U34)-methyltransferase